ncbi:MAG: 3-hydroxyisobutyrate dehydrogenase [Marmoricola sp.]|nr:3-hydroxyisobutyrate dehydrogenase [Marmoricola sp.]
MTVDTTSVGFIGLGQIGRPMALRLADWPGGLWAYDVVPDAVDALVDAGATRATSIIEVAENSDVICLMVRDDDQVREVLATLLGAARSGLVVVVHSTIHPDTASNLATVAAAQGVALVDAPVSGGSMGASDGRLAIMVGGTPEAFERCRPVLEQMGSLVVHLGPVGSGTSAKLARNLLHFVSFTAVTEAQRLAEAAGIDLAQLGAIVRHTDKITGGAGAIMYRDTTVPLAADDAWRPIFEHVRALGEKDLGFALELGKALGVDTPLAAMALDRLGPGLGLEGTQ